MVQFFQNSKPIPDERLELAIEIGEDLEFFDCSFLYSLQEQIKRGGSLTPSQKQALDNIIQMMDEGGYW